MKKQTRERTIIIALPSYNEADRIRGVVQVADKGLSRFFKNHRNIIVNADNHSPDNTKQAFLNTKTKHKKIYLNTKTKGKGRNLRAVFNYAKKIGADAVTFIDADITSATPDWIRQLVTPILNGYDHVLPLYLRNEYDGSITNHLAYPVLYGVLGADLRQPLAGEVGVSKKAINAFLARPWPKNAYHYGIDIFLVTESLFHNLKMAQTYLGIKAHKPSAPKLDPMFLQVADVLFRQFHRYRTRWQTQENRRIPTLNKPRKNLRPPELVFDYKHVKEEMLEEYRKNKQNTHRLAKIALPKIDPVHIPHITETQWAKLIYALLQEKTVPKQSELKALRVLFFMRFLDFYRDEMDKTHQEAERKIKKQAATFQALKKKGIK